MELCLLQFISLEQLEAGVPDDRSNLAAPSSPMQPELVRLLNGSTKYRVSLHPHACQFLPLTCQWTQQLLDKAYSKIGEDISKQSRMSPARRANDLVLDRIFSTFETRMSSNSSEYSTSLEYPCSTSRKRVLTDDPQPGDPDSILLPPR